MACFVLVTEKDHRPLQYSIVANPTWQCIMKGRARTQSPTLTNYAPEFPTLGGIAGFNSLEVQWGSLDLEELPCWSQCPLSQVSMPLMAWFSIMKSLFHLFSLVLFLLKKNVLFVTKIRKWDKNHTLVYDIDWFLRVSIFSSLHDRTVESSQGLPCCLFILQYANDLTADYSMSHIRFSKRPHTEVVQYRCNPRVQVSKLSHRPSLSKISLIFWTCSAGRIRY